MEQARALAVPGAAGDPSPAPAAGPARLPAAGPKAARLDALAARATAVLAANWRGRYTVPSPALYPHQWSWDSAFVAIGLASVAHQRAVGLASHAQHRAQLELATLLGAQWPDGRIPHIVFDPDTGVDAYFPGPRFWSPGAPVGARRVTSGLVQPPIHARAAWEVYRKAPDREAAAGFLRRVYEPLCRWHAYLRERRDLGGAGLAAIVHPWESGMDNSPAWDGAVRRARAAGASAPTGRSDLRHVPAAQRPGDEDYAAYIDLAARYRDRGYEDADLLPAHQFAVEDPLFNGVLAWSEEALARIATAIGADHRPHTARARALGAALVERLYDPGSAMFFPRDVTRNALIPSASVAGLAALVSPGLPPGVVARACGQVTGPRFAGALLPSYDRTAPEFSPARYWRGPSWANTTWLVIRGLRRHGDHGAADDLAAGLLRAVAAAGFREYFDADTGAGAGATGFSWTAALTLDLLS